MWEWLAGLTTPVPRGDTILGMLLVLGLGAILGFGIAVWMDINK